MCQRAHSYKARLLVYSLTCLLVFSFASCNDFLEREPDTIITDEQLRNGHGYDHNYVLNTGCKINKVSASIFSPTTGILMEVYTCEPGLQFYVGNFLDGTVKGKRGVAYPHRSAICMETQHYPNSPNQPQYPSTVLRPGETYHSKCVYKFKVTPKRAVALQYHRPEAVGATG